MGRKKKEERWITAQEATRILSQKAGRAIDRTYIGSLVRPERWKFDILTDEQTV